MDKLNPADSGSTRLGVGSVISYTMFISVRDKIVIIRHSCVALCIIQKTEV